MKRCCDRLVQIEGGGKGLGAVHTTPYTPHPFITHFTQHTAHYTLHTAQNSLNITCYTLHTTHYTLHTTYNTKRCCDRLVQIEGGGKGLGAVRPTPLLLYSHCTIQGYLAHKKTPTPLGPP